MIADDSAEFLVHLHHRLLSSCRFAPARLRRNGRCERASRSTVRAPYDQCLSSRRFMLRRAPNMSRPERHSSLRWQFRRDSPAAAQPLPRRSPIAALPVCRSGRPRTWARSRRSSRFCAGTLRALPPREKLFQLRRDLLQRGVADHDHRRVVGTQPRVMKLHQIFACQLRYALIRSRCRSADSRTDAPLHTAAPAALAYRHQCGSVLFAIDSSDDQFLLALHLLLRITTDSKPRPQTDRATDQASRLQRRKRNKRQIKIRRSVQLAPSDSSSSLICSALRVRVPSVSTCIARFAVPGEVEASEANPASTPA